MPSVGIFGTGRDLSLRSQIVTLEISIRWEAGLVAEHCLVQDLGLDSVKLGEIGVEQDAQSAHMQHPPSDSGGRDLRAVPSEEP